MTVAQLRGLSERQEGHSACAADRFTLRSPRLEDGPAVHALIRSCPPLDQNSAYANLVQCAHFADTCVVAIQGEDLVGWVSGHRPPNDPKTIFVWQVAVAAQARGAGLGHWMLGELISRPACRDVRWLKTTITEDNRPSWSMFGRLAEQLGSPLRREPWLIEGRHLPDGHATEHLVTIGPFAAPARR
jgi:L-2,4-diaminobutyric acid acetyltransferase